MPRRKQSVPKKHDNMDDSGETITKHLEGDVTEADRASTTTATTEPRDSPNPSPPPHQPDPDYRDVMVDSPDAPQDLSTSSISSTSRYNHSKGSKALNPSSPPTCGDVEDGALDLTVKKRMTFCATPKNENISNLTPPRAGGSGPKTPPGGVAPSHHHLHQPKRRNSVRREHYPTVPPATPTTPRALLPADLFTLANFAALSSLLSANNSYNRSIIERDPVEINHEIGRGIIPNGCSLTTFNGCSPNNGNFFGAINSEGIVRRCSTTGNGCSPTTTLTSTATWNGRSPSRSSISDGCSPVKNGCSPDFCSPTTTGSKRRRDSSATNSKLGGARSPASKNARSPSMVANLSAEHSPYAPPSYVTNPVASSTPNFDALSKLSNLVSKVGSRTCSSTPYSASTVPQSSTFATPSMLGRFSTTSVAHLGDRAAPTVPLKPYAATVTPLATVTPGATVNPADNFFSNVGQFLAAGASDQQQRSPPDGVNFHELWWKFVKKEENAEMKRLNEAKQIFTCLQCQASFQTMDQLVKHMEATQHYTNIPKHYSWSLQYARQKMRQMKMKMKYSDKMMYFCFLCQSPFTEPVQVHFNLLHSMHNPAENMKYVQIMSCNKNNSCNSKNPNNNNNTTNNINGNDKNNHINNNDKNIINLITQQMDHGQNGRHHKKSPGHQKNTINSTNFIVQNGGRKNYANSGDLTHHQGNSEKSCPNITKLMEVGLKGMDKICEEKKPIIADNSTFGDDNNPLALLKNIVK